MTRDEVRMLADEAGCPVGDFPDWGYDFAALVAAHEREQMQRDGWRQCAVGQRTTQWCAMAVQLEAECAALRRQAEGRA